MFGVLGVYNFALGTVDLFLHCHKKDWLYARILPQEMFQLKTNYYFSNFGLVTEHMCVKFQFSKVFVL